MVRVNVGIAKLLRAYVAIKSLGASLALRVKLQQQVLPITSSESSGNCPGKKNHTEMFQAG